MVELRMVAQGLSSRQTSMSRRPSSSIAITKLSIDTAQQGIFFNKFKMVPNFDNQLPPSTWALRASRPQFLIDYKGKISRAVVQWVCVQVSMFEWDLNEIACSVTFITHQSHMRTCSMLHCCSNSLIRPHSTWVKHGFDSYCSGHVCDYVCVCVCLLPLWAFSSITLTKPVSTLISILSVFDKDKKRSKIN